MIIRDTRREDLPALIAMIDATELFPGEMLTDMAAPFLDGGEGDGFWLTAVADDSPVGVAYVEPERMTEGTWNFLLIAVHPARQGQGDGRTLLRHVEARLANDGQRLLLVETSGLPAFERTRSFYVSNGYGEEARIRDFYQAGEDKIVFRKVLAART
jgi:ribosomal protein S18 acetylase RimI-like enzyme